MGRGQIGYWGISTVDTVAERKRVVFRPATAADTVRIGDLVCYNSDLAADWKELTANRLTGDFGGENATAYAEGSQTYNGRFLIVEKGASGNLNEWAGVVAVLGPKKGGDGDILEIWVPREGAVVPVYTDVNCTLNTSVLGVSSSSYLAQTVTGDDDPLPIGVAVETVDRSGTNGLVWCRLFGRAGIGVEASFFSPSIKRNGRAYGFTVGGDNFFQGVAGAQEYLVHLEGGKSVIASGDCYGGILKISGGNDVVQPTSYIMRGINVSQSNDGTLGQIDNFIGVKNNVGTCTTVTALSLRAENYGTNAGTGSVFGGLDILLTPEGTMAEKSFGIRVRNNNASLATAVAAVLEVSESGANTGFTNLLYVPTAADLGIIAASGDIVFSSADKLIPIKVGSTTYYLVATDNV